MADFAAGMAKLFPNEYKKVIGLRQDLKIHHFTLTNMIKDVEMLASNTKDNLRRSIRKMDLRKKKLNDGVLTPTFDRKIWKYEAKA